MAADPAEIGKKPRAGQCAALPPASRRGDRGDASRPPGLTGLAADWRKFLFPNATDERFADGYAQAVTFGAGSWATNIRASGLVGPHRRVDAIQPDRWPAEYTSDLLDLLNVLGRLIGLEPAQAALLTEICAGTLVTVAALREAGAIPAEDAG